VSDFLSEYNAGTPGLADRFFAPAGGFQWYSEPPGRLGEAAYVRSTLAAYLARRHAEGDHLTVVSVQLNGVVAGVGNLGFSVARGAQVLDSKGALFCQSGMFIVWSLGPNPGP
jgi:hypothetical protein